MPANRSARLRGNRWYTGNGSDGYSLAKTINMRKRKPKKFTAGGEARRRARELAGPPPAARIIPDKRLKPPKHKGKLLEESGK